MVEAVGLMSDLQVQITYRIRALEDTYKLKACRDHEKYEGRVISDMLDRFILIGGPLIKASTWLQEALIKQA